MGDAITVSQLNERIKSRLEVPELTNVWVTGELIDVRASGMHLYAELLDRSAPSGKVTPKVKIAAWGYQNSHIRHKFVAATGSELAGGIKVMVCLTVSYNVVHGMTCVVTDINPTFTLGDIQQRRQEIIQRLQREGIYDLNRQVPLPAVPQRIAVISARNAAGYGDFVKHLLTNTRHIRFHVGLFPSPMQGENTAPGIIGALDTIAAQADAWDLVVIIRGGGATADFFGFEDYNLAAHVAQFPLPVMVGIGHERDTTVLDFVAGVAVKTPTAAADWLITRGGYVLDVLRGRAQALQLAANARIANEAQRLARYHEALPARARAALDGARRRLRELQFGISQSAQRNMLPRRERLDAMARAIARAAESALTRQRERLERRAELLQVLSPQATLRRGYSITRINGRALTSASEAPIGATVETILAEGSLISQITETQQQDNKQ